MLCFDFGTSPFWFPAAAFFWSAVILCKHLFCPLLKETLLVWHKLLTINRCKWNLGAPSKCIGRFVFFFEISGIYDFPHTPFRNLLTVLFFYVIVLLSVLQFSLAGVWGPFFTWRQQRFAAVDNAGHNDNNDDNNNGHSLDISCFNFEDSQPTSPCRDWLLWTTSATPAGLLTCFVRSPQRWWHMLVFFSSLQTQIKANPYTLTTLSSVLLLQEYV